MEIFLLNSVPVPNSENRTNFFGDNTRSNSTPVPNSENHTNFFGKFQQVYDSSIIPAPLIKINEKRLPQSEGASPNSLVSDKSAAMRRESASSEIYLSAVICISYFPRSTAFVCWITHLQNGSSPVRTDLHILRIQCRPLSRDIPPLHRYPACSFRGLQVPHRQRK